MKILNVVDISMVIISTFILASECAKSTLKEFLKNMICIKWYPNTLIEALISLQHVDKKFDTVSTHWLQRVFPKIKKFLWKNELLYIVKAYRSMHLTFLLILQISLIWPELKRQIECTHTLEFKTLVNSLILKIFDLK